MAEVEKRVGWTGEDDVRDGAYSSATEMLAALAQAKWKEIQELRAMSRVRDAGDQGYGLRISKIEEQEGTAGDESRKVTKVVDQSLYVAKRWQAEKDLRDLLKTVTNVDLNEAMVKAEVKSRQMYVSDLMEAINMAKSFPQLSSREVLGQLLRDSADAQRA